LCGVGYEGILVVGFEVYCVYVLYEVFGLDEVGDQDAVVLFAYGDLCGVCVGYVYWL